MRETILHLLVIALISGAVFFTNLGEARLWDRDEPRNAGCAAEMLQRGDWIVPTFNGELRHQKPVLLYWLMMSVYPLLGVNEFSARFWSATLAIVTTMATYGIARRLTNPTTALLAAVALATSLMFDVAARAATPDSVLICCSTCAIYLYTIGVFSRRPGSSELSATTSWFPESTLLIIAMYCLMGLGVLAKGPVGVILPMAILGMLMLIKRLPKHDSDPRSDWRSRILLTGKQIIQPFHPVHFLKTFWAMKPLVAISVVLLIASPWFLMVAHATNGEFAYKFFVGEHFGRATVALENHSGGIWFYPLAILIGFFPWSVLWGPVAIQLLHQRKSNSTTVAGTMMLCWIGVQVGLFSCAQTKLPSYVTPCYPALAILAAVCLRELCSQNKRIRTTTMSNSSYRAIDQRWLYAALGGLCISGALIALGLGAAASFFLPSQSWLAILGAIPLVGGIVMISMLRKQHVKQLPIAFAATSVLFCWCAFGFGTVSIDGEQESHLVLDFIDIDPQASVAAFGCLESSWVYYGGKPIRELLISQPASGSLALNTHEPPAVSNPEPDPHWLCKPKISVEEFLNSNSQCVFLTSSDHVEQLKKRLPEDYEVLQTAAYFLKNKQLVLIGKRSQTASRERGRVYH